LDTRSAGVPMTSAADLSRHSARARAGHVRGLRAAGDDVWRLGLPIEGLAQFGRGLEAFPGRAAAPAGDFPAIAVRPPS
jgi:hypothetical protein